MKKYLAILLAVAMVACTKEPTNEGGGGGTGGTGGVPDNGLGYYEDAKVLGSTRTPITNIGRFKHPIVGFTSEGFKKQGNWIENNHSARIPTAVTLSDGTIVLTGDLRWSSDADAPHKTSSFVRISKDVLGETWDDVKILNNFNDIDLDTVAKEGGVAVGQMKLGMGLVDNSMGVAQDDTLIALHMFNPPTVGLHGGSSRSIEAHPFTNIGAKDYLLLRESGEQRSDLDNYRTGPGASGPNDTTKPDNISIFKYGVDVKGGPIVEFTSSGVKPVVPALYADEYWELYADADFKTPYMTNQMAIANGNRYKWSDKQIHAHLFFYASPYAPSYVNSYLAYSKSTDRGKTWSKPKELTHQFKTKDIEYGILINSPAKGYLKRFGQNKGRLLFSAYKHTSGKTPHELPIVFWTDDKGETWDSADNFVPSAQLTGSESVIVEMPNGDLMLISRSNLSKPLYSISLDSGKTWSALRIIEEPVTDPGYFNGIINNQLSAINISHYKAQNGRALIAISHARGDGKSRKNGHVTFAALNPIGNENASDRDWELDFLFNGGVGVQQQYTEVGGQHDYSGIIELQNGDVASFYEGSKWIVDQNNNAMEYVTIPLRGL